VIQIVVAVVKTKITTINNVDIAQKANDGLELYCLHGRECISLLLPLRVHKNSPIQFSIGETKKSNKKIFLNKTACKASKQLTRKIVLSE
jgi:hypothetical protein